MFPALLSLVLVSIVGQPIILTDLQAIESVNKYRAAHKLPALLPDPTLMKIAQERVGVFNHNHPRYGWVTAHAARKGFTGAVTDNLAQGYSSCAEAVGDCSHGWGKHKGVGHDQQMLGKRKINGKWVDERFNVCGVAHKNGISILVLGNKK